MALAPPTGGYWGRSGLLRGLVSSINCWKCSLLILRPLLARTRETKDNETMIYVKTLSGQRIVLEVIATDTVEDVKTMLQHKLPVEEQVESKKPRLCSKDRNWVMNDCYVSMVSRIIPQSISVCRQELSNLVSTCLILSSSFPSLSFTDIIHHLVALERTLLPYQHLLVTLRGRSSVVDCR